VAPPTLDPDLSSAVVYLTAAFGPVQVLAVTDHPAAEAALSPLAQLALDDPDARKVLA
jgi:hypothetical protein